LHFKVEAQPSVTAKVGDFQAEQATEADIFADALRERHCKPFFCSAEKSARERGDVRITKTRGKIGQN
jgi:hypothetical protein